MLEKTHAYQYYLRNWQLFLFSYFVPILLFIPFLILAGKNDGRMFFVLASLASTVCSTAFFLASSQREFMARYFTFLLPNFRRGMVRQHFTAAIILALADLVLVLTLPGFAGMSPVRFQLAASIAALMFGLYGLTALLVFHFPWSTYLPFNSIPVIFLSTQIWGHTPSATLAPILNQPLVWGGLAMVVGWWLHARLSHPGLHRRCAEEPYLSIGDIRNQARIEQFKQARGRHKTARSAGTRPGGNLIRTTREWSARQWAIGRRSRALVGEALTVLMSMSIPRRRTWVLFHFLFVPTAVIGFGYYEGYQLQCQDGDMYGWFSGMIFMYSLWPMQGFHHLKSRPQGMLRARRDQHGAAWLGMGMFLVWGLLASAFIMGLFMVGNVVLPDLPWHNGVQLDFTVPPMHLVLMPLLYLPVVMIVFFRWRMCGTPMVLQQTGTLTFFIFNGLLISEYGPAIWVAMGLAAVAWMIVPWVWRWRVFRSDLA